MSSSQRLIIVAYHAVVRSPLGVYNWCFLNEAGFRRQVSYLVKHFHILPLLEGVQRLKHKELEGPSVALTFDDGYRNTFDLAFPILRHLELPFTVFLTTGFVDSARTIWPCQLLAALIATRRATLAWEGQEFNLSGPSRKKEAYRELARRLKRLPQPDLLSEVRKIVQELGEDPELDVRVESPFRMLGSHEVQEMCSSGLVDLGAHTHSHAILGRLPEGLQSEEIERSLSVVGEMTGTRCLLFSYPNGQRQDYDLDSMRILKEKGVHVAVTMREGENDPEASPMELRRIGVGAGHSMLQFRLKVHGLSGWRVGRRRLRLGTGSVSN